MSISPVKLILSIRTLSTFSFSFSSSWNTYMTKKKLYCLQHILSNVYRSVFFFFPNSSSKLLWVCCKNISGCVIIITASVLLKTLVKCRSNAWHVRVSVVRGCVCARLLCGSQAVLCSAEDAANQAELVHGELCSFRAFFLLQQTADGKTPTVTAGSG